MDYGTGALATSLAVVFVGGLFGLLAYAVGAFLLSKIFSKAGVEGTWRAWVPIYNMMVFFKLGNLNPWLVLYAFIGTVLLSWIGIGFLFSFALFVASALAAYRIGQKLDQEPVWVVLWLIPLIWLGVTAYSKASWNAAVAPAPWAGNAFLADRTNWAGVPSQEPAQGAAPTRSQAPNQPKSPNRPEATTRHDAPPPPPSSQG